MRKFFITGLLAAFLIVFGGLNAHAVTGTLAPCMPLLRRGNVTVIHNCHV